MKILLKILVAPFALALSLLAALLVFLFDICAVLLTIASVILVVLGIALFFTPTQREQPIFSEASSSSKPPLSIFPTSILSCLPGDINVAKD